MKLWSRSWADGARIPVRHAAGRPDGDGVGISDNVNPHLAWSSGYYEAHMTVPGVLDFYGDWRIGGPFGVIGGFNKDLGFSTSLDLRWAETWQLKLMTGHEGGGVLDVERPLFGVSDEHVASQSELDRTPLDGVARRPVIGVPLLPHAGTGDGPLP